ncbi:penicillin-binding protein 2 [Candidatus Microgenomates bacterium]|nr:penicillin-binding protein 2 [Candidatus Microgenomates bacterium]
MRLKILAFLFALAFLAVSGRLFYWQVVRGDDLSQAASYQHNDTREVVAPRGDIYASDGSWLAVMRQNWLVFAELPKLTENKEKVAEKLSSILAEKDDNNEVYKQNILDLTDQIYSSLTRKEVVWVPLKHKVTSQQKSQIEKLAIEGIGFEPEDSRFYPEASSSAQLLGFVGKDDDGLDTGYFGLEGYYDIALSGKPGFLLRQKDVRGAQIVGQGVSEISSSAGADLVTHIDKRIQLTLEENLQAGLEKYGAKQVSGIIMDPKTGAVLAMGSYPSFDPKKYFDYSDELFKNPIISDVYEPGSVFKIMVMAAGLDSGAVDIDTKCDICGEPLKVDKYYIKTWNNEYTADSTMTDVIVHSDNVGMSFVAQKLGADLLYDYLDKFGIGHISGVDLQGEVTSQMREKGTWNIVDLATTSFGQGISTTSMQIITAVAAIANKGVMMQPQVVDKVKIEGWGEDIKPKEIRRVISTQAASKMTTMMEEAANNGEAQWTNLPGFGVAGKTGTAQIPIAGHYDEEKTIASFVGFAPSTDPKFVMLITLREPQSSPWASETAAPLWYSVARDLFTYFGIQPEN